MAVARAYQKYPEAVKLQIAKAKNPYLFPEFKIPRTTALYWIKTRDDLAPPVSEDTLTDQKISQPEHQLQKEKSLILLVKKIRGIFPYNFKNHKAPSKSVRRKIVEAVKISSRNNLLDDSLEIIGLSRSTYANWLSEFYLCEDSKGRCKQRKPHQLTHDELETMRKLIISKKHSHFSIQSLCLFAQREGLLFCSLDSWYKYKKIFSWNRPRIIHKEKTDRIGVRAKRPNEIWHIDVTQVKTLERKVIYIQVIYDNFSRFVLAWKVSTEISAANTVALIALARKNAIELGNKNLPTLISDGGSENNNHKVLNFINSKNIKRLIAKVDIHFSNSMVESLFRMLKSNFLSYEKLRNIQDVERKAEFFFNEHNKVIPRYHFDGATPEEKFLGLWTKLKIDRLKEGLRDAATKRKLDYKIKSCGACENISLKKYALRSDTL